jgi:hypothetical protein
MKRIDRASNRDERNLSYSQKARTPLSVSGNNIGRLAAETTQIIKD